MVIDLAAQRVIDLQQKLIDHMREEIAYSRTQLNKAVRNDRRGRD